MHDARGGLRSAGSTQWRRGPRNLAALLPVLAILCMLPGAARNAIASDPSPGVENAAAPGGPSPGHPAFWDYLVVYAAMGTVAGVVEGHCQGESFKPGPVVGHVITAGLLSFLGSQGTDFLDRHPPATVSTLEKLRYTPSWRTHVVVRMRDGTSVSGTLVGVTADSLRVRDDQGRRTIPGSAVLTIERRADAPWDMPLIGAGAGALYALVWANNCGHHPVTYVSRGRMAAYGAAILGTTGLALDLLHDGRAVLFRADGSAGSSSWRIHPIVSPHGAMLAVSRRF